MIQIQDVSFEYEKEQGTLSHIDLNIQQGECVVLTGESGCGKTTVTKLINGLTIVNGMEVPKTEMYRLAEQVGSVFQNPKSQFFNIDSDSEITFGLENAGVEPKKIKERYEQIIEGLGLNLNLDFEFKKIEENFIAKKGRDYAASRGEYLNGIVMARD